MSAALRMPGRLNGAVRPGSGLATQAGPPAIPAGAPMIGRLASFATPATVHALTMRCRACRVLLTDESGDSDVVHTAVREHWSAEHGEALAAMTTPPAAKPASKPATPPEPRKPAAPRPVVQRAKPVTEVKQSASVPAARVRPALARNLRTCEGPECEVQFDCSGAQHNKRFCSGACRDAFRLADRAARERRTCALDGCEVTFPVVRDVQRYCSRAHGTEGVKAERAARPTAKLNLPPAQCAEPRCTNMVVQRPGGRVRLYCSKACGVRASDARVRDRARAHQPPPPVVTANAPAAGPVDLDRAATVLEVPRHQIEHVGTPLARLAAVLHTQHVPVAPDCADCWERADLLLAAARAAGLDVVERAAS